MSNSLIKFIKDWIVVLSRGKHKTITNNTFFDDFSPLDNEIELKTWVSSTKEMNLLILPIGNVCVFTYSLYLENAVTKPPSKSANLESINSSK